MLGQVFFSGTAVRFFECRSVARWAKRCGSHQVPGQAGLLFDYRWEGMSQVTGRFQDLQSDQDEWAYLHLNCSRAELELIHRPLQGTLPGFKVFQLLTLYTGGHNSSQDSWLMVLIGGTIPHRAVAEFAGVWNSFQICSQGHNQCVSHLRAGLNCQSGFLIFGSTWALQSLTLLSTLPQILFFLWMAAKLLLLRGT